MWQMWAYFGARVLGSKEVVKVVDAIATSIQESDWNKTRTEKKEIERLERQIYKRVLEEQSKMLEK